MAEVCPAILATTEEDYRAEMEKIAKFAHRIQIDLTDGNFAKPKTVSPTQAWWPVGVKADFHLMYGEPMSAVKTILEHKPNLVIMHAESSGNFEDIAQLCHHHDVKVGLALLARTDPATIEPALANLDHVLIFSGLLGEYGGHADLSLLEKVKFLKERRTDLEIGWDGGISTQNVSQLVFGGVDVLNAGGFIQNSENPQRAYESLARIAEETGTT